MSGDTLERDRLRDNLIDRVERLERRSERLGDQLQETRAALAAGLMVQNVAAGLTYRFEIVMTDGVPQLALRRVTL